MRSALLISTASVCLALAGPAFAADATTLPAAAVPDPVGAVAQTAEDTLTDTSGAVVEATAPVVGTAVEAGGQAVDTVEQAAPPPVREAVEHVTRTGASDLSGAAAVVSAAPSAGDVPRDDPGTTPTLVPRETDVHSEAGAATPGPRPRTVANDPVRRRSTQTHRIAPAHVPAVEPMPMTAPGAAVASDGTTPSIPSLVAGSPGGSLPTLASRAVAAVAAAVDSKSTVPALLLLAALLATRLLPRSRPRPALAGFGPPAGPPG